MTGDWRSGFCSPVVVGFELRPVQPEDADRIIELRRNEARNKHVHPIDTDSDRQMAWLRDDAGLLNSRYFAVVSLGHVHGFLGLTDIDFNRAQAEWGRWQIDPASLAAVPSVLLIYQYAFEHMCLERLYCRTNARNEKAVRFHDGCGLERSDFLPAHFGIRGERVDAIEHTLVRGNWPKVAAKLQRLLRNTSSS